MSTSVVLQSWKQIAEHLGRTERTAQRWELEFGLPVHRPSGKSRSSVMALAQEIEEWTRGKPSLKQIRTTARLNRAKLPPSPNRPIRDFAHEKELRQQNRLERRRHAALVDAQRQLLRDVDDRRRQQHDLLQLLIRNLGCRQKLEGRRGR